MEVVVSILEAKNLSQSSLIMRNLFATLQVGSQTQQGTELMVKEAHFRTGSAETPLVVTVKNGQTQTVMYVRNVPLSVVAGGRDFERWVSIFPAGDPRNLAFDESAPRPEAPQIRLSIKCTQDGSPSVGRPELQRGNSDLLPRGNSSEFLQRGNSFPGGDSGFGVVSSPTSEGFNRPFTTSVLGNGSGGMDRAESNDIREKERQAADIKEKVSAMAEAQRRAQSTEQQIQEYVQMVEDLRRRVWEAESKLRETRTACDAARLERDDLRNSQVRLQEQLENQDRTLNEIGKARDESDRQLSQALQERERQRFAMDDSTRNFGVEVQSMAVDLDKTRQESGALTEELRRREMKLRELQQHQAELLKNKNNADERTKDLQAQLAERQAALGNIQSEAREQRSLCDGIDSRLRDAHKQLAEKEASFLNAQNELFEEEREAERAKQSSSTIRNEVEGKDREVVAQMGRVAQLEGQLSENRNQLREMAQRIAEVEGQLVSRDNLSQSLNDSISSVRASISAKQQEHHATSSRKESLESALNQKRRQLDDQLQNTSSLEQQRWQDEANHRQRTAGLREQVKANESQIQDKGQEIDQLQTQYSKLEREIEEANAEAQAEHRLLAALEQDAQDAKARLASLNRAEFDQGNELRVAQQKVDDGMKELEMMREQLQQAEDAAEAARKEAADDAAGRTKKECEAESVIAHLQSELREQRGIASDAGDEQAKLSRLLEVNRTDIAQMRLKLERLLSEKQADMGERKRLETILEETRHRIGSFNEESDMLQERLRKQRVDINDIRADGANKMALEKMTAEEVKGSFLEKRSDVEQLKLELEKIRAKKSSNFGELENLRAELLSLGKRRQELEDLGVDRAKQLANLELESTRLVSDKAGSLIQLQDELARADKEKATIDDQCSEHEERVRRLEADWVEDDATQAQLKSELAQAKKALDEAQSHVERQEANMVNLKTTQAEEQERLAVMKAEHTELQDKAKKIRAALEVAQSRAARAKKLRDENESLLQEQRKDAQHRQEAVKSSEAELEHTRGTLERTKSELEREKSGELNRQIQTIDELEREQLKFQEQAESLHRDHKDLMEALAAVESDCEDAAKRAAMQSEEVDALVLESGRLNQLQVDSQQQVEELEKAVKDSEQMTERHKAGHAEKSTQLAEVQLQAINASEQQEEARRKHQETEREQIEQNKMLERTNAQLRNEIESAKDQVTKASQDMNEKDDRLSKLTEELEKVHAEHQKAAAQKQQYIDLADDQLKTIERKKEDKERMTADAGRLSIDKEQLLFLQEQVKTRKESLDEIAREKEGVMATKKEVDLELKKVRQQLQVLQDKLQYQIEHSNLQFQTIEKLEDEKRVVENESEILTLGLHEADQKNEYLQKENYLMRQQVEGLYQGSLQDWADEVHRLKVAAEVERHKDELNHWKQVAAEAERELRDDSESMQQQQEEQEMVLRDKLNNLRDQVSSGQGAPEVPDAEPEEEPAGSVHSVPTALHGLVVPHKGLPPQANRRKALIVGINYSTSHAPLRGCINDAWGTSCLLRHSLQYGEDQVLLLMDGSEAAPMPKDKQPTRRNLMEGLLWLVTGARPGDSLFFAFSGYGAQHPKSPQDEQHEAHLVPCDFAEDLPKGFFDNPVQKLGQSSGNGRSVAAAPGYRLIPLLEIMDVLLRVPPACRVTILLDCCHSNVPNVHPTNSAPVSFKRVAMDRQNHVKFKQGGSHHFMSQPRFLDLPPLPFRHTPRSLRTNAFPECRLHCYSGSRNSEWCAEFPIEGVVQGAFTWAFIKALTAGHFHTTVQQHSKAMAGILQDLKRHFHWVEQTPILQLSSTASMNDVVLSL